MAAAPTTQSRQALSRAKAAERAASPISEVASRAAEKGLWMAAQERLPARDHPDVTRGTSLQIQPARAALSPLTRRVAAGLGKAVA